MRRDFHLYRRPRKESHRGSIPMRSEAIENKLESGQARGISSAPPSIQDDHPVYLALTSVERSAWALLQTGMSQRAVGDSLGLSKFQVHRLVNQARGKIAFLGRLHELLLKHPSLFRAFVGCAPRCRCPQNCPHRKTCKEAQ